MRDPIPFRVFYNDSGPDNLPAEVYSVREDWADYTTATAVEAFGVHPTIEHENGIRTRLIGNGNSKEAILYVDGLATDTDAPNSLLQGAFIRAVLYEAGITNAKGDPLDVVTLATQTEGHTVLRTRPQRKAVAHGRFDPFSLAAIDAVKEQYGYELLGVSGASIGAVIGLNIMKLLAAEGITPLGGDFKEYASVVKAWMLVKAARFIWVGRHTPGEVEAGDVAPYSEIYHIGEERAANEGLQDGARYVRNLAKSPLDNLANGRGLSRPILERDLGRMMRQPGYAPITFTTGTDSDQGEYVSLYNIAWNLAKRYPQSQHFVTVSGLLGRTHAWVDHLPDLAASSLDAYGHLRPGPQLVDVPK